MLNKKLLITAIFFVLLLAVSAVSAADNDTESIATIDSSANDVIAVEETQQLEQTDSEERIGEINTGNFTELEKTISDAGANCNIKLVKNYTYGYGDSTDGIQICENNVTIDGDGNTINAQYSSRIFNITGSNVTLKNIIFTGGIADYGGAILWEGANGKVSDCSFVNNSAENGGAIYSEDSDLNVEKSKFINNSADVTAGAILVNNAYKLTIAESEFINNAAQDDCGAIFVFAAQVVITNSRFENNKAPEVGVIYFYCNKALINESYFINNTATDSIAAILNHGIYLTVDNSHFINNSAGSGSTIRNKADENLILSNSIFESDCLKGRTVDNNYGNLYLYNNTINKLSSEIHNYGGKILSPCTAIVRAGTTFVFGDKTKFAAIITDDNGNLIEECYYVYFNVSGKLIEAEYNSTTSEYGAEYVFDDAGLINVYVSCPSINITDNQGVNITVNKTNSTLTVNDMAFDYNGEGTSAVSYTGAIGVVAEVVNQTKAIVKVNGNSITVSGLDVGTYTLTVTTIADANHYPITKTAKIVVNALQTQITASAVTATYDINKNLVVTLKDSKGNAISGVRVIINLNGAKTYTTDNNGQIKVNVAKMVPKAYTAKISFAGNSHYKASSANVKVTVKKAKAKITAKKKTFKKAKKIKKYTITLKANKKPIKKVWVTLKIKGKKVIKAKTNNKGKATFKIKKLTKKGKYKAVIKFKANKCYLKATKNAKITIK